MLPLALINLLTAGIWHWMPPGAARWAVGLALVLGAYLILGNALMDGRNYGKRTYRYAD
ncbi:hypothetical protein SDC9_210548 [bioreactor metagenome]|uniref:Uncharacterized protein n=1 Tax=bioreactor metagenome TaxID=1076179 RepID=A0A645JGI9_9ZZZZ